MRTAFTSKFLAAILASSLTFGFSFGAFAVPQYQDDQFASNKKTATLWQSIPFFPAGDIAQFEKTMAQDRDSVRKNLFNDLIGALEKLAEKGAAVEVMLEPLANIMMMFDQVHDIHKAKDVINIDKSLEAQFKASLDANFTKYDVRNADRKIQISGGTEANLLQSYIRGISVEKPLGQLITQSELDVKVALEMFEQIDYVAYGTFSNLGNKQFQLTLHLQGNKNGVTRNFIARGKLIEALDDLAKQIFDYFQKNVYPDWQTPHTQLTWMPQPANPGREQGYSFAEAKNYCTSRGYRLPYARELIMAANGGAYKKGGIGALEFKKSYAVADRRMAVDNYVMVSGNESATGGPVQADGTWSGQNQFWCVQGQTSAEVLFFEKIWSLIRKYRLTNKEVYVALETLRFALADFGAEEMFWWGPKMETLHILEGGVSEAKSVLSRNGIALQIPAGMLTEEEN